MGMPLATAQWAEPARVEEDYLYREGTLWLGRSPTQNHVALGFDDDRHVCLVSGSRGGKGTTSIINNLCLWPGSVVVIDPKGENATLTAARRGEGGEFCEGMGQAVHVLDPFGEAQVDDRLRSRFNPLDQLNPDDKESFDEAGRIADALVVIYEGTDPYWAKSAREMIWGLILHVLTAPGYEGRRNLVTVYNLIARGDWEAFETLLEANERDIPSADGLLWQAVARNPAFGGRLANIGQGFVNMLKRGVEGYESVIQEVRRFTEFINSPAMEECLTASDFTLSDLKTSSGGVSLFLSLPQRYMETHVGWLRMMIGLTLGEMERTKGQPASGHRVLFLLDEFAGLQRMKVIENGVAQMAGFGVKMFFVLQSLEQLKAVYKDNWETFLANSGLKLFFNVEDHFSREYVSKLIGETEIIREVRSEGDNSSESESSSESTSRSRSESTGESTSHGRSVSEGTSSSTSKSETHGKSSTTGHSWGWSVSQTGNPRELFGMSGSSSRTYSLTGSEGTSESWSTSETRGVSRGSSESSTEGRSRTVGSGSSETSGTTRGTTRGRTSGMSETIHRRPLISPDEIGKWFARIDDRDRVIYPGLGLAVIAGKEPVALHRVNYYEDLQFIGLFSPHPEHRALPVKRDTVVFFDVLAEYQQRFAVGYPLADFMTVGSGEVVRAGDVIGVIKVGSKEGFREVVAKIKSPRTGRIVRTSGFIDMTFRECWTVVYYDSGEPRINPFAGLDAYCRATAVERLRKQVAAELRRREEEERRASAERAARTAAREAALRKIRQRRKRWLAVSGAAGLGLLGAAFIPGANGSLPGAAFMLAALGVLGVSGWKVWRTVVDEREIDKPPKRVVAMDGIPGLEAPKLPALSTDIFDKFLKGAAGEKELPAGEKRLTDEEFEKFMKSFGLKK